MAVNILLVIGGLLLGIIIGFTLDRTVFKPKFAGTLMMFRGGPDEAISMYTELEDVPENLLKREYVIFRVKQLKS